MSIKAKQRYYSLLFLILFYIPIFGQGFQRGGIDPSTGTNISPISTDTVKKPPLELKYYQIKDIGFVSLTNDSLPKRSLFADLQNGDIHNLRLGNMFAATRPARFDPKFDAGNKIGIRSYDVYGKDFKSGYIPSPNRPLAFAEYGTRFSDGHNNIGIDFNRTFARNITFGFHLFAGKSDGQFSNQATNYNRLEFNLVQANESKQLTSYAHFSIYRNGESLNGGMTDPSSINQAVQGGNASRSVNSIDASMKLKNTNFKVGTSIRLGVDSVITKFQKYAFIELGSYSNTFNLLEPNLTSTDKENYFPLRFSAQSLDSKIKNQNFFGKAGLRLKSEQFQLIASLHVLQNLQAQDSLLDINTNQIFVHAEGGYTLNESTDLSFDLYQGVTSKPESKYGVAINHKIRNHEFQISASVAIEQPGIVQSSLSLNGDVQWENDFLNEKILKAHLKYFNAETKSKVLVNFSQVNNLIYLAPLGNYAQLQGAFSVLSGEVSQRLTFFNFIFDSHILAQSISKKEIIALPTLSSRHDLNTGLNLFKKRLETRFGAIIWLQNSSTHPSFHPIINDFYYPNADQSTEYIRIMPYLRARIDTFEFYISTDDMINQYFNRHHFSVAGYPELDSRINLGFRWRLLD